MIADNSPKNEGRPNKQDLYGHLRAEILQSANSINTMMAGVIAAAAFLTGVFSGKLESPYFSIALQAVALLIAVRTYCLQAGINDIAAYMMVFLESESEGVFYETHRYLRHTEGFARATRQIRCQAENQAVCPRAQQAVWEKECPKECPKARRTVWQTVRQKVRGFLSACKELFLHNVNAPTFWVGMAGLVLFLYCHPQELLAGHKGLIALAAFHVASVVALSCYLWKTFRYESNANKRKLIERLQRLQAPRLVQALLKEERLPGPLPQRPEAKAASRAKEKKQAAS